jgi:O-antigen/teichoic acid export membrane protein
VAEGPAERAAARVARNTTARAAGEILGKLASLVLFAVLARTVGEVDLGAFVFAFAWAQIATIPVGLGFDRYVLRRVARDNSSVHDLFFNVLTLKLVRAVPITAVSFALVSVLGYDSDTRLAVYLLTAGTILDSISRTVFAVFNAYERGYLIAATVVVQRFAAAGLGLAVLAAGGGIVEVSGMFAIGTGIGLALAFVLMSRSIGLPARSLPEAGRQELRSSSRGYGAQDILGMLLAKIDAVLLSFLATEAAVGRYGAAYRLLESTFFLTSAVNGAFAAMYAYLDRNSEPSVDVAFERSIKLALCALVPCGVAFGILAEPLSRAFFGAELEGAAGPLALLAPVVVLLGVVTLGSSLLVGRREPGVLVRLAATAVALNIALNLALIPPLDDDGAALAMLITAAVFAVLVLRQAVITVEGVRWRAMGAGPLVGGAAMAAAMVPLSGSLALALPAGTLVYGVVLYAVERALNPRDLEFLAGMVRRRLPGAVAGQP